MVQSISSLLCLSPLLIMGLFLFNFICCRTTLLTCSLFAFIFKYYNLNFVLNVYSCLRLCTTQSLTNIHYLHIYTSHTYFITYIYINQFCEKYTSSPNNYVRFFTKKSNYLQIKTSILHLHININTT